MKLELAVSLHPALCVREDHRAGGPAQIIHPIRSAMNTREMLPLGHGMEELPLEAEASMAEMVAPQTVAAASTGEVGPWEEAVVSMAVEAAYPAAVRVVGVAADTSSTFLQFNHKLDIKRCGSIGRDRKARVIFLI